MLFTIIVLDFVILKEYYFKKLVKIE